SPLRFLDRPPGVCRPVEHESGGRAALCGAEPMIRLPAMALPVIPNETPLSAVLGENSFTLGQLNAHPLAAPFVSKFDAFQDPWFSVHKARALLEIAAGKAQGAVHGADDALDDFVDELDRTLLIVVKNDRKAPLYQIFFGDKPPHLLK